MALYAAYLPSSRSKSKSQIKPSQYLSPNYGSSSYRSTSPQRYHTLDTTSRLLHREKSPTRYGKESTSGYGLDREKNWYNKDAYGCMSSSYSSHLDKSMPSYSLQRERSPGRYILERNVAKSVRTKGFVPSRNTVWTDLSLKYPRHTSHYCTGRNEPYVEGWRSRLAREAQRRPRSERRWHYADDEEAEEGFSVRTNRGCGEAPHDSVVSRTRTIQLEALTERPEAKDAQTQVDEAELELSREQEERRLKRTFLSSRHHSYYDRYLSPMPWRGRYSTPQSSPLASPQVVEPPVSKKETGRSPSSEEEGETGYDTDSCYDTEGFLTDRSCALSLRSLTPYGDFTEDSVSSGIYLNEGPCHQRSISESTSTIAEPLTDFSEPEGTGYLEAKDLCFRFLTTAEGSSQRDSGFAELLQPPQKGTDYSSVPEDDDHCPPPADVQTEVFVGDVRDVDLLLSNEPFQTLEDLERFVNRYRDDVRKSHCCEGESKGDKKRPKELKLDIGFVGRCRDIDEVLGWTPEPPSPVDSDTSKLDDCTLQLFRYSGSEGDYGSYLDLESTIDEQAEDFEDFHSNRKNTVILRTQLSVRVHSIIEKLLSCSGRELRRALFSLKQIFQDDKDLVHEFVQNDGLACLIKVGSEADQNYQNYILRALGQVMLYVDGMNGVIEHIETIQWLYSLIASKYRLVVKTTLKLLLVFVEYSESNSQLLINTVCLVDSHKGSTPWSNIMNLLKEKDSADMELLVYAVTLINKTLNSIPDQDTYYDMVDSLEEQGMEHVIQYYMSKQGTDLDLLQQLHIYEAVLKHEDGVPDTKPLPLDARFRRSRTSVSDENERRKSRRHSLGTVNGGTPVNNHHHTLNFHSRSLENTPEESPYWQDRNQNIIETKTNHHQHNGHVNGNGHIETNGHGVTPSLRRRRERDARNKSLIKQQEENGKTFHRSDSLSSSSSDTLLNDNTSYPSRLDNVDMNRQKEESIPHYGNNKKAWMLSMMYAKSQEEDNNRNVSEPTSPVLEKVTISNSHQQVSYSPSKIPVKEVVVPSGIVGRAKDGLASGGTGAASPPPPKQPFDPDVKWEQLVKTVRRPLLINGLDFTDLRSDEDDDVLEYLGPPEGCSEGPPPPPLPPGLGPPPPPPPNGPPPPAPPSWTKRNQPDKTNKTVHPAKTKKTIKLFWREVREDRMGVQKASSIWDDLTPVHLDTQKLEHLFQNRAKEVPTKEKGSECVASKKSEVIVLDTKRSNAINIAMTKLPPPRTIKTAVLKMDSTIVNREGIEKVLGMLPTEDEKSRISEAQLSNPDVPLGSAEQFLLTLASISELEARLRLWAFRLDYDSLEREVAEPLMDLKQAMKEIEGSETLRVILSTLRSVGNFLNGVEIKGFHIEYLSKVPEVKDTVQKHSLLHHLCHIVMERFPNSSDLYSELGSVTRASKIDYCEVSKALNKMESECKASWDYLKAILKHDCNITLKVRTTEFLTDCAERIIVLKVIHRRMLNRYHKFLLYLGCGGGVSEQELSVQRCCRILSEFALEYRTTRERVLQQIEKKANHRQRNKTRGKMITDMDRFKTKEQLADQELRQLLNGSGGEGQKWGTVPTTRGRVRSQLAGGSLGRHSTPPVAKDEGGVDEDAILESLVKTATAQPHKSEPRIRKKARYGDRKSLRRTLKGGLELSEEERNLLTTMTT